ncbi:MAG TPA: flagellar biosynthetic protein FliR [Gemmatimonadales bacterium]|nr:flagellar biosynthetic protein FliR [Gemmatimonadales bacterium]
MNTALLEFLSPIQWPLFALVSARVVGLLLVAPLWSMQAIPARIRAAMAVMMSLALLPTAGRVTVPFTGPLPILSIVNELLLGLAIGFTAAVFMHGLTVAAEVVSLQMGLSLGAAFGGSTEGGAPGIGQLYGRFTLVLFAGLGGHVILLSGVAASLIAIPPGQGLDFSTGATALVTLGGTVFSVAIRVAAPVMVALLVTNLALAVLNRAVPQLNTMMVAVPITVAVGLITIGGTMSLVGGEVTRWVAGLDDSALRIIAAFRPLATGGP